jgi:hypothetical protein
MSFADVGRHRPQSTGSPGLTEKTFDAIQIEVLWNRLISIIEEQATVLIRMAFTNIISDAR